MEPGARWPVDFTDGERILRNGRVDGRGGGGRRRRVFKRDVSIFGRRLRTIIRSTTAFFFTILFFVLDDVAFDPWERSIGLDENRNRARTTERRYEKIRYDEKNKQNVATTVTGVFLIFFFRIDDRIDRTTASLTLICTNDRWEKQIGINVEYGSGHDFK